MVNSATIIVRLDTPVCGNSPSLSTGLEGVFVPGSVGVSI